MLWPLLNQGKRNALSMTKSSGYYLNLPNIVELPELTFINIEGTLSYT